MTKAWYEKRGQQFLISLKASKDHMPKKQQGLISEIEKHVIKDETIRSLAQLQHTQ